MHAWVPTDQKRVSGPIQLEVVMNLHVGPGNQTQVLWFESVAASFFFQPTTPSQPFVYLYCEQSLSLFPESLSQIFSSWICPFLKRKNVSC